MQRSVNNLIGNNLDATDGEIGRVEDFYFDDQTWTIRYLVVKTGSWLSGRKVLISPNVLLKNSWESGMFPVRLSKEQVRNSPDIDTEKPISRQYEQELADYYPWEPYWGTGFYPGQVWGVIPPTPGIEPTTIIDPATIKEQEAIEKSIEDTHLRSCRNVTGYHIRAIDGDIGHVNDFILDDQTWQISQLLVDTHNRIGGKKVLIPVRHVKDVEWDDSKVILDLNVEAIKDSPAVDKWDFII
jgi:sporulation protein YlmC with PRC-barrel domain